ncbi:hypothetical protein DL96DRAFT_1716660 [Flagelloscypha sp. PMI_526]|nr:hypothetical protein DL96DRAFT_1716660 [Flagelloscypha sp. PMI_526]
MELPREHLFYVLEAYFNLPPPRSILAVLLLSKSSYNLILPKLYHTLSLSGSDYPPPGPGELPPDALLHCAKPSSLALTKRLNCSSEWWHNQFDAVANLRLEELFVWDKWALDVLAFDLSDETPLCGSIRKLGFRNETIIFPHQNWLQHCPNLTQIFVICESYQGLQSVIQTCLPISPSLQCFLIVPSFAVEPTGGGIPDLTCPGDRREALGFQRQSYHFEEEGPAFWASQSAMWKEVTEKIAMNPRAHEITVID